MKMRDVYSEMLNPVDCESELVKLLEKPCADSDNRMRTIVETMFEALNIDPEDDDEDSSFESSEPANGSSVYFKGKLLMSENGFRGIDYELGTIDKVRRCQPGMNALCS